MVVIFGWGAGDAKDLGEVAPLTCPNCHNEVFLHHIRSEKKVSLYFVPLIPYGSNEYLACPICRHGLQVRPDQRPAINEMRAATSVFRRGAYQQDAYRAKAETFWRTLGVASTGARAAAPPLPAATAPQRPAPARQPGVLPPAAALPPATVEASALPSEPSITDRLMGLAKLHAQGILTDEEFAAAKQRVLEG